MLVGVEEHVGDVLVEQRVRRGATGPGLLHHTGATKDTQVLGHQRLADAELVGEFGDRPAALGEAVDDGGPYGRGKRREQFADTDIRVVRFPRVHAYIFICAMSNVNSVRAAANLVRHPFTSAGSLAVRSGGFGASLLTQHHYPGPLPDIAAEFEVIGLVHHQLRRHPFPASGEDLFTHDLSAVSHLVAGEELGRTSTVEMGGDVLVVAESTTLRDGRSGGDRSRRTIGLFRVLGNVLDGHEQ